MQPDRNQRGLQLVVCERYRLIYRPLPKCGSTTVIDFLGDLGGYGEPRDGRDFLPLVADTGGPGRGSIYAVKCRATELPGFVARYAGYLWFSVVREPYGRLKSNYFNKLNRYARKFEPAVYLIAYGRQLLAGRAIWRAGHEADRAARLQESIPFPRFVSGLEHHGIAWDPHFAPQAELLRTDVIPYRHLVRLEHLRAGLRDVFDEAGAGAAARPGLDALKQLNRSSAGTAPDPDIWTADVRRIVADLYRRDFETLDYAA